MVLTTRTTLGLVTLTFALLRGSLAAYDRCQRRGGLRGAIGLNVWIYRPRRWVRLPYPLLVPMALKAWTDASLASGDVGGAYQSDNGCDAVDSSFQQTHCDPVGLSDASSAAALRLWSPLTFVVVPQGSAYWTVLAKCPKWSPLNWIHCCTFELCIFNISCGCPHRWLCPTRTDLQRTVLSEFWCLQWGLRAENRRIVTVVLWLFLFRVDRCASTSIIYTAALLRMSLLFLYTDLFSYYLLLLLCLPQWAHRANMTSTDRCYKMNAN